MIKKHYDKKTGRIHNLLFRSHEEIMTNDDQLFGKKPTVYGESKMIEVKKSYVVELTEEQARQLYNLLQSAKSTDQFSYGGLYDDLRELHKELKQLFDSGIR